MHYRIKSEIPQDVIEGKTVKQKSAKSSEMDDGQTDQDDDIEEFELNSNIEHDRIKATESEF